MLALLSSILIVGSRFARKVQWAQSGSSFAATLSTSTAQADSPPFLYLQQHCWHVSAVQVMQCTPDVFCTAIDFVLVHASRAISTDLLTSCGTVLVMLSLLQYMKAHRAVIKVGSRAAVISGRYRISAKQFTVEAVGCRVARHISSRHVVQFTADESCET